ncbi:hypothetical protein Pfo_021766 [Paulownia fortunei]|nr:hypothetical protein Pfo_021766 [Paulownia fortunei]
MTITALPTYSKGAVKKAKASTDRLILGGNTPSNPALPESDDGNAAFQFLKGIVPPHGKQIINKMDSAGKTTSLAKFQAKPRCTKELVKVKAINKALTQEVATLKSEAVMALATQASYEPCLQELEAKLKNVEENYVNLLIQIPIKEKEWDEVGYQHGLVEFPHTSTGHNFMNLCH